jgi:uncharacterized protein (DUF488 family)
MKLYTIGHSNLSADEFIALLKQHGITTLVDVRSQPVSQRFPHFNKDALAQAGITYRYAGHYLGGRPTDPDLLTDGEPDPQKIIQSAEFVQGIARLLNLTALEQGELAVMCAEGDPLQCHRHNLIARALLDPSASVLQGEIDLSVQHILPDGSLIAAKFR